MTTLLRARDFKVTNSIKTMALKKASKLDNYVNDLDIMLSGNRERGYTVRLKADNFVLTEKSKNVYAGISNGLSKLKLNIKIKK